MRQRFWQKINIAALLAVLWIPGVSPCALVVLDRSKPAQAELSIQSDTQEETVLELRLGAMVVDTVVEDNRTWTSLSLSGAALTSQSGWPELPQISAWVQGSAETRLEVVDADLVARNWGIVRPVADPLIRSTDTQARRNPRPEFYSGNVTYPELPVQISQRANLRGEPVVLVTFVPVQFSPESGLCTVYTRIRVRLTHEINSQRVPARSYRETTTKLLKDVLTTSPEILPADITRAPRLIIVTEPPFLTALQPLIDWKLRSGLPSQTLVYSQVASSEEELRSVLVQLVGSLSPPPEFLLIVGDVDLIPSFFGVEGSLTDHPYSTLIGGDYLPDISVGRLPCHSAGECARWVERIMTYERNGEIVSDPDAVVVSSASALDPLHGMTVTALLQSAGFASDHLQEPQTNDLARLTSALDTGREWVFYIGHGFAQGWTSVLPTFGNSEAQVQQNSRSSIVLSIACATADLDYPGTALGELWSDNSEGPLAFFGATEPTPFFYSDTLGLGVMRAVFSQHTDYLGIAADIGRLATATAFPQPPGGLTEETIQQFMLLGDPSMRVYSASPEPLSVTYPSIMPIGAVQFTLNVQHEGQPVPGANVCLSDPHGEFYAVHETNAFGNVDFELEIVSPVILDVTVTAHNSAPFVGELRVVHPDGPFLQFSGATVLDLAGDNDGRADRRESCALRVGVSNLGSVASDSGSAIVSTDESQIELQRSELEFPGIEPGDTVWLEPPVSILIGDSVTDLSAALIRINISSPGTQSVTAFYPLVLHAPELALLGYEINEVGEYGDIEPGGGVEPSLSIRWRNVGSDRLSPLTLHLATRSPEISIPGPDLGLEAIPEGDTLAASFNLHILSDLPAGYPFEFSCEFTSSNLPSRRLDGMRRLAQIPCFLYQLDRRPQQVDAIASALTALGIEFVRDTLLPENLVQFKSVWVFCGVFPNQQILSGSDGERLADYLQEGGKCYLEGGDTWAYDPPTAVHPYFHIRGVQDGTSNAGPVRGEFGTQYQDYFFEYLGENSFIDQLAPDAGAITVLRNDHPNADYPVCIAYAGDGYRTIGSSIELGGMDDASYPSTRVHLLYDLLQWFGIRSPSDVISPQIIHQPVEDCPTFGSPIPITADIQDASGIHAADLIYRINGGPQITQYMTADKGRYRASLSDGRTGDSIAYSIRAEDNSPLHQVSQTDEYSFVLSDLSLVPYTSDFVRATRTELTPYINEGQNCSWSQVTYPDTEVMLELHGSCDSSITFSTPIIDCSRLRSPSIVFQHFLRPDLSCSASYARVTGSTDGGLTFPNLIWQDSGIDGPGWEGRVDVCDQGWLSGQRSVVLRFEFRNNWYWRIGNISVKEGDRLEPVPVMDLTILPLKASVRLNWRSDPRAVCYSIWSASGPLAEGRFEPVAETYDTTFIDSDLSRSSIRMYRVYAIMNGPATPNEIDTTLRPLDRAWSRKFESTSR